MVVGMCTHLNDGLPPWQDDESKFNRPFPETGGNPSALSDYPQFVAVESRKVLLECNIMRLSAGDICEQSWNGVALICGAGGGRKTSQLFALGHRAVLKKAQNHINVLELPNVAFLIAAFQPAARASTRAPPPRSIATTRHRGGRAVEKCRV